MQIRFCGAARQVTGSCYLFENGKLSFLVDCGLFQGAHATRAQNYAKLLFEPRDIAFVLLTHAHLDHSGLLPRLVAEGFAGPIYATSATRDLLEVMLPDAAQLQLMEAERAIRQGKDFRPIYTLQQAKDALRRIRVVRYGKSFSPGPQLRVVFQEAGHILGSAIVEIFSDEPERARKIVVSGDLGQPGRPIVRDPAIITAADVLLLESTYGNRDHKSLSATLDELVAALQTGLEKRHGVVLIPSFAVGRTQELLYYLRQLCRAGRLGNLRVFVDSPMATEATEITARHMELFDEETKALAGERSSASDGLSVTFTGDVRESMALNRIESGAIIIAGSGMCDGGRIRHHLRQRLDDPRTTVLIVGYQATGTLGRRLVDRAPIVRVMGQEIRVRANIVTLGGFSAHADQSALLAWLQHFKTAPRQVFLVHGEELASTALAARIGEQPGWQAIIPGHGESVTVA